MPYLEYLAEGRAGVGSYAAVSLCTQQLNWCAVKELSLIVSYVTSTAAVGRVILGYCKIVLLINPNPARYQVNT